MTSQPGMVLCTPRVRYFGLLNINSLQTAENRLNAFVQAVSLVVYLFIAWCTQRSVPAPKGLTAVHPLAAAVTEDSVLLGARPAECIAADGYPSAERPQPPAAGAGKGCVHFAPSISLIK